MSTADPSFLAELANLFPSERVITSLPERLVYECDGHTLARGLPEIVVLPETTAEVQECVRLCSRHGVSFVARGAGTGLSGGAVAKGGVLLGFSRMNRILELDAENRVAVVQPGVVNAQLGRAAAAHGLRYAPDPSSQGACTLGGNVAENSGGPHTLRYGVTSNHVLGLEVVLPDGTVLRTGSRAGSGAGLDLTSLFVGSEGTFGIVTEITVRLIAAPPAVRTLLAVYDSLDAACQSVTAVIAAGIVPAALELIDRAGIEAVEAHLRVGYPREAEAVLLIEVEGTPQAVVDDAARIEALCLARGAVRVELAADEATRARLWKGRKQALGAVGKIAKAYYTHDGVVPRSRVPEAIRRIGAICERLGLRVANVCHAGDGNLHPLLLFDPEDEGERQRVHQAGVEILTMCVEFGGALTGEHGVGLEKRALLPLVFNADDLEQMDAVRRVFDPEGVCNPGKALVGESSEADAADLVMARNVRTGGWV